MNEQQLLDELKQIDRIVEPEKCNTLSSYLNGYITDYENTLHELNLAVSNKWLELREQHKSDSKTDRALEISDIYQKREKTKLTISQLKRLRGDLRDRFAILSLIKRY